MGRLAAVRDASGTKFFDYDNLDRLTAIAKAFGEGAPTHAVGFDYKLDGTLRSIAYDPPGTDADETVTYDYDAAGWMRSITSSYGGVLASIDTYDDVGRPKSIRYGTTGMVRTQDYQPGTGWLQRIALTQGSNSQAALDLRYSQYDDVGNVQRIDDFTGLEPTATTPKTRYEYNHDLLDRLTSAKATSLPNSQGQQYQFSYDYNSLGNLTREKDQSSGTSTWYSGTQDGSLADAVCHIGNSPSPSARANCAFQYDSRGNLAQEKTSTGDIKRSFSYWATRRLRRASLPDGTSVEHVFDGVGGLATIQVTQPEGGSSQVRLLDDLIEDTDGVIRKHYYFSGRLGSRVGGAGSDLTYYHTDHLDSVRVTTSGATVQQRLAYLPFGKVDQGQTVASNVGGFGFTGQRTENAVGLLQFHARHYDPQIKRFIQPDPLSVAAGGSDANDAFGYAANSPINMVDPAGLQPENPCSLTGTCSSVPDPVGTPAGGGAGAGGTAPNYNTAGSTNTPNGSQSDMLPRGGQKARPPWYYRIIPGALEGWEIDHGADADSGRRLEGWELHTRALKGASWMLLTLATSGRGAQIRLGVSGEAGAGMAVTQLQAAGAGGAGSGLGLGMAMIGGRTGGGTLLRTGWGLLSRAGRYGVETYNSLARTLAHSGLEAHHLIPGRFADIFKVGWGKMPSIAVTHAEHRIFTKAWYDAVPYGTTATKTYIQAQARQIYRNYPRILNALKSWGYL
jgi:RHS repeat-associated protein